jgi:hypothetical protein
MEQERREQRRNRRHLDHLKRKDQEDADMKSDQPAGSEGSEKSDQNFDQNSLQNFGQNFGQCFDQNRLTEERSTNRCGEEDWKVHRLNLGNQGDELMGDDTHDRALEIRGSPPGIDHQ